MADAWTYTFSKTTDVPRAGGGTQRYEAGQSFSTNDACEMLGFMTRVRQADPDRRVTESEEGSLDNLRRAAEAAGCVDDGSGTDPRPGSEGNEAPTPPPDGDTPASQGALAPPGAPGEVGRDRTTYGGPGETETPAEAMNRAEPVRGEVVQEALEAEGVPRDEAAEEVERGRRGDPPEGEPRTSHAGERTQGEAQGGEPVDLFSGRLHLHSVDLDVPTAGLALQLSRRYLSGKPYLGPLGFNWDHGWNVYLRELASGDVARWSGELHEDVFRWDGARFEPPRGIFEVLERPPGLGLRYLVHTRGGNTLTFERPAGWAAAERIPLVEVRDRAGNRIAVSYDTSDRVALVRDDDGRFLRFHYGSCGFLERVEDHAGRRVEYWHDQQAQHLVMVRLPATADFPDGVDTHFEYAPASSHPAMVHNVVRVSDHARNTYLVNVYEEDPASVAFNRVVRQYVGEFAFGFCYEQLQWVPQDEHFVDVPAWQTGIHQPDGSFVTQTFNYRGDLLDERYRLVHDGSFRVVAVRRTFDAQGNLVRLTRPDGSMTEWTYDHAHPDPRARTNLLRLELRSGGLAPAPSRIVFRATYEPSRHLLRTIRFEDGAEARLRYDFDLAPGAPGNVGALRELHWPDAALPDGSVQPAVTRLEWNPRGQLAAVVSPSGVRRELEYEPAGTTHAGLLRRRRDDAGGVDYAIDYAYDATGFLSAMTLPGGRTWSYRYDAHGRLAEHRLPPVGGVSDAIRYGYDGRGRVVRVWRPRGELADGVVSGPSILDEYGIDPLGRVHTVTIGANTAAPRRWVERMDFAGRPVRIEDPLGVVTTRRWDERGLLLEEIEGAGLPGARRTRWFYDLAGRPFRREEPGGLVHGLRYDPWGRLAEVTFPNGARGVNRWGVHDLLVEQELHGDPGDGSGERLLRRATHEYDARGRLVRYVEHAFRDAPAAAVPLATTKWYDADGRAVRRVGPRGQEWRLAHDGLGRLTRTEDPLGNVRRYDYALDGFPSRITEVDAGPAGPRTRASEFEHDARGRLVRTRHPSGAVYDTRWDARDLPVESSDPNGVTVRRVFGLLGERLRLEHDVGGLALAYVHTFDPLGRELTFVDPTGETTRVVRDPLGRVVEVRLADGGVTTRAFDAAGRLASETAPDGSVTSYAYDAAGRLERLSATPGPARAPVPDQRYAYDGANRLVRAAAGGSVAERAWDSLDRIVSDGVDGRVFARAFHDVAGAVTVRFPDGREERQELDLLGRVRRVTLGAAGSGLGAAAGAAGAVLLEADHLGPHRLAAVRHGNGVHSSWEHDDDGRLIRVDHAAGGALLESARYRHELYNRRRVAQHLGPPAVNHVYRYDARGRLVEHRAGFPLAALPDRPSQAGQDADVAAAETAAAAAPAREDWTLDGADTRLSETATAAGAASVHLYVPAAGHRIVAVDGQPLAYDADGRRTADARRAVVYDALGRAVRVDDAASAAPLATFSYDPMGRWSGDGAALRRLFLENDCLQEESGAGAVLRQLTHVPGMLVPLVATSAAGPWHLHFDGAHNLSLATDAAGAPAERYRYGTFGAPRVLDGAGTLVRPASALGMGPWFGSLPFLAPSGLYFTLARLYDPATGQFLARDPYLHLQSPSPYVYALHDPVNGIDPTGALPPLIVAGLVVGGIGAAIGVGSVLLSGEDYDGWDLLAAGVIGFGAGFIGGVTFGWAAGAIGGGLLSLAGGSAAVAATPWIGTAISVTSGVGAGALSGLASGVFSGTANGVYHGGIRGRGDMWQMIGDGAYREGLSGMAAGAVGGGLFQGALRLGRPGVPWAALQRSFGGGAPARVIGRGLLSPYGLGGAAGIGFASGYTGGVTGRLLDGDDLETAMSEAWREGLAGAGGGVFGTALHPTTYQYWRIRLSPSYARSVESTRPGGIHHQRNVADYPEYTVRRDQPRAPHDWLDRINNAITRGNITGPQSEYNAPNNPLNHRQMHEQWRFGAPGNWTNLATHGPWTPPWNPNSLAPFQFPASQTDKEQ